MSKKRRIIEILKTCLIILLFVSALFLAARTQLFDAFFASVDLFDRAAGLQKSPSAALELYEAAALPTDIVVTNSGGHYAGERETLYANSAPLLGEALGSSREPTKVSATEWRQSLSGDSIYFSYAEPVRLSVLAGWFSTGISHDGADSFVRRLCLAAGDGTPLLYYMDESSGNIYRCATAASLQTLLDLTAGCLPDDSRFAFELGERFQNVDDCMLIRSGASVLPLLTAQNPIGTTVNDNSLLSCFGMNTYISSRYTEQSGDTVYVEGETTLRTTPTGFVSFRQGSDGIRLPVSGSDEKVTEVQAIEAARQLLDAAEQTFGGIAAFSLESCSLLGDRHVLTFVLQADGMRIHLPEDQPAAEIVIQNGHIVQARILFRTYSSTQENSTLLPGRQAAAVAETMGYREAAPGWQDSLNGELLAPQWLLKGGI